MKKWSIAVSLTLLPACNTDRIAQLEKQNKEMRAELERQKSLVDLDTQNKCSNAALSFFRRTWSRDKDTVLLDYSNHYNKALGKCFILVEWHYNSHTVFNGSAWFGVVQIHDVFENNRYAEISERHAVTFTPPNTIDTVTSCNVDNVACGSMEEFHNKTRHYMVD
jgi:hypothetical protein